MKILINAYAVRPNSGSEGGAAWQWITRLSQKNELYIITEGEWRKEIEQELAKQSNRDSIHFYYNTVSDKIRRMCWNQGDYRFYFYYAKWQKKTLAIAKEIMKNEKIDLIHQLNMIGFREPGYLWKIKRIPFVWGPIGGMNMVPMQYMKDAPIGIRIKYRLKNFVSCIQYKYSPRVLRTIKRADALLAANKASYDILTKLYPNKYVTLVNETGSNSNDVEVRKKGDKKTFDILWVGRFIPTKLLGLSLEVFSNLRELPGLKVHIVGQAFDEVDTERYHLMAKEMGIESICQWHGWVSHDEVQQLMQKSDIFFFPSVVEGTPHVVLEAIANCLPIVCFDTCGQAEAVDDTVGRKIQLSTPRESIDLFTDTIKTLYKDRVLLASLSNGCINRKQQLSWDRKFAQLEEIYEKIISEHSN